MIFGIENLRMGSKGIEVIELQLRLAGFLGTIWDGDFGKKTELQVKAFQKDYMGIAEPDGIVGRNTYNSLDVFAHTYLPDFVKLKCPCGECNGFGHCNYMGEYIGDSKEERYYKYEYPGIHKAIIYSFSALEFYSFNSEFLHRHPFITSGYRCWIRNRRKGRNSTNHMGKAIDSDYPMKSGEDKRDDINRCNNVRKLLVEKSNFQLGWSEKNKKSLEPESIAPSWIHMDIRNYEKKYLDVKYFVKNVVELESKKI